jgi:hypothetical protein
MFHKPHQFQLLFWILIEEVLEQVFGKDGEFIYLNFDLQAHAATLFIDKANLFKFNAFIFVLGFLKGLQSIFV